MTVSTLAEQALAAGLVQPDQTTCGSSVLVVARVLNDPTYAAALVDGAGTVPGQRAGGTLPDRWREQVLAMHRLTSGAVASGGRMQLPWPTALGTQPWSLAREMTAAAGEKGTTYAAKPILPGRRGSNFDRLRELAVGGHAVPLYVGNRWSPRHVVLVLPVDPPPKAVMIYDPASGRRYPITAGDFTAGRLDVAGWRVPWLVVVPG